MGKTKTLQAQIDRIQALSELVSRAKLAAKLGQQYGTDRDIYQALGYPASLSYDDFVVRYDRQDIAAAIIDKPVDASWQGGCLIQEATEGDTPLEKGWKDLIKRADLDVINKLVRLDKLVGIGSYAIMLFGLSDVPNKEAFATPAGGKVDLIYLQPIGEGNASIARWETDPQNPRYGLPVMYEITLPQDDAGTTTLRVHYTRVLHVAGKLLEGNVKGVSRLEAVYNRLFDLEKLVGGSAEMFWRGARPGYKGKVEDGYTLTSEQEDDLEAQLDEYEHNLRRFLISAGIDLAALETQVADPDSHVDVQLKMISAYTGIPKRILTGSERGELASTQDINTWNALIQGRRENYVEGTILRPFIRKCQEFGVLPPETDKENGYSIIWKPLFEQSDKEKAEVGETRAKALNQYAAQPMAESIVPPEAFYKYFLGLEQDQIDMIEKMQQSAIQEDQKE